VCSSILSCTYILPPFLFFCSLLSALSYLQRRHLDQFSKNHSAILQPIELWKYVATTVK
jgi:hypothetical protein